MFRKIAVVLAGAVAFALAGCASTGSQVLASPSTAQQNAAALLTKLQGIVNNGCLVVQPTLSQVAVLDPTVGVAAAANGLFCASVAALDVSSIKTLLATGIPAIDQAIAQSTLIPANQKPIFTAAVGLFALTVQNALTAYENAIAASQASAASEASAPVAASQ
jgi:hypothetical protein